MSIVAALPDSSGAYAGMIREDRERHLFRVARQAFTDEAVLEAERRQIFDRCWLYIGHGSEIAGNCDFLTRSVGGRELIFNRDRGGAVHAFLNTCPHRGATVVRESKGNALSFRCFYHGWSFNVNGRFASRFEEGNYGKDHYDGGCADLVQVPRLESYRDFWFINFDRNAVPLPDYLAQAKEFIDLVADQAEAGMEIIGSGQQYIIKANWKLLAENSVDAFHGLPTHSTYFDYLQNVGSLRMGKGFDASANRMTDLGNGHAVIEYGSPWGRPIARWVPAWGEETRDVVQRLRQGLIRRFGEVRGLRMAETSRNMIIFPNLVINDIMAITVRTFYPEAADRMAVSAWALGPCGEDAALRKLRLFNFLEFLGPGGFATPDDQEALENCQRGYRNMREAGWNDISKGMPRAGAPRNDDEEQMRCFWREWRRRMTAAA
ncbi:aromatic ring-hydroxylating oxygenase subunit alpha [Vineibacter terrae]|nr:aromatic ring-hydroxylating dioxygenase subunit alpha [Vineibacter terrae]